MKTPSSAVLFLLLRGDVSVERLARDHDLSAPEVERLRAAFVEGLEVGRRSNGGLRGLRAALIAACVGLVVLGAGRALSGTCAVPSFFSGLGLNYFCADEPALASEANANFEKLARLTEAKVGALGPSATGNGNISTTTVAASGAISGGSLTASLANVSYFTPPYASWVGSGAQVGAGGAAIVNDNGTHKALMIVGNNSAAAARRVVRLWDDVRVEGRLTVADKQCRTFNNGCQYSGSLEYMDRQVILCGTDEALKGFSVRNCGGNTVEFTVTCCKY